MWISYVSRQYLIYLSKMKKFILLCVVLAARIHAEFVSPFPKEYDQFVDACRMETGYTDEVFAKEEESYFSENRELRKYHYCFLEKTGFVTSDGKLNIDDVLAKLTPSYLKDVVEYCNDREKIYPKNIFSSCFHSEVKQHMQLSLIKYVIEVIEEHLPQIVKVCSMETGYTDEVIAEEEKSNLDKDSGLEKFNDCVLEKTGFRNDELYKIDHALAKIPQSNVTEIIEDCQSLTIKKMIPDSLPFFSGCLLLGVSAYIRTTGFKLVIHSESDQVTAMVFDCQEQTGFTLNVFIERLNENNSTEDEGVRKFNDCFLEKTGVITSDGKLSIDAALAKLPPSFAKPIIEHCQANIILKYAKENVHDFSTCYNNGIQNYITELETISIGYAAFTISWKVFVPGTFFVDKVLTY